MKVVRTKIGEDQKFYHVLDNKFTGIIYTTGKVKSWKEFFQKGYYHRESGPAIEFKNRNSLEFSWIILSLEFAFV